MVEVGVEGRSASMFKWLQTRRTKRQQDLAGETQQADRDSGEEEYESEEEVAPSGMTRVKTDDI
jgi:hypothetical protein